MDPAIDRLQRRAANEPRLIGLAGGLPSPDQFPRRALTSAFLRALGAPSSPALQYGWPEGTDALRAWIAGRLRARGADVLPGDVLVTAGAQQGIAVAIELLARSGDVVGLDPATYPSALDLFRGRELRLGVGWDGADVAYVMPAVGNPSGHGMGPGERAALLRSGVPVIEDDAYGELRFDGDVPRPLLADAPDRVFHVGTLSKVLCPGLRVGWLVPPRARRDEAVALKQTHDLQTNSLAQAIVEGVLGDVDFDARLARLRRFYERRARRLADAVARHLPRWTFRFPEGGFSLWVRADVPVDEVAFLDRAVREGVSFDPGRMFRVAEAGSRSEVGDRGTWLRLCYSLVKPSDYDEAVRRLARAYEDVLSTKTSAADR